MPIRFYKRIKLGKRVGINISKSGISPSIRTKLGSISKRGFSIRTGIPGLIYRKNFSSAKGKGCFLQSIIILGTSGYLTFKLLTL